MTGNMTVLVFKKGQKSSGYIQSINLNSMQDLNDFKEKVIKAMEIN